MIELIYHFAVIPLAIVSFFMIITANNELFEFILKSLTKIVALFIMIYAVVEIFKYYGVICS